MNEMQNIKLQGRNDDLTARMWSIIASVSYFMIYILAETTPMHHWLSTKFDRKIGQAIMYGISVSARVRSMYVYSFVVFIVAAALIWILIKYLPGKRKCSAQQYEIATLWATCGIARLLVHFLDRSAPALNISLGEKLALISVAALFIFCLFDIADNEGWLSFFSVLGLAAIQYVNAFLAIYRVQVETYMLCVGYVLLTLIPSLYFLRHENSRKLNSIIGSCWPIAWFLVELSVFYEVRILLSQHGIFLSADREAWILCGLAAAPILVCAFLALFNSKKELSAQEARTLYYFPMLLGMCLLASQPALAFRPRTELFESANAGMAVYNFMTYGELPILQNFDAHMLSQFIGKTVYALFSGDTMGAIWGGYSMAPLFAVLFFYFMRVLFNREVAFYITVFFPWGADQGIKSFIAGLLPIVFMVHVLESPKWRTYFAFWIGCAVTSFWKLDIGMACASGAAMVLCLTFLLRKNKQELFRAAVSGIVSVALTLGILYGICHFKGIDPVTRLKEFLDIALSNPSWAYRDIVSGKSAGMAFLLAYFLCPATVVLALGRVFSDWRAKDYQGVIAPLVFALASAYVLNFPRGLVRHSLVEAFVVSGQLPFVFVMFAIVVFFVNIPSRRDRVYRFVGIWFCIIALVIASGGRQFYGRGIVETGIKDLKWHKAYSSTLSGKRLLENKDLDAIYVPLKEFFDQTLEADETYCDFTRNTLLYALTGRKKPVYVNQSPELLSGEYSQKRFIDECQENKTVYALLHADFRRARRDGVMFSQKFYLVSEWLAQNYMPLCVVGQKGFYAVWCRNNQYEEKMNLIKVRGLLEKKLCENVPAEKTHEYRIYQLPRIWGEQDVMPLQPIMTLQKNFSLAPASDYRMTFKLEKEKQQSGNYLTFSGTYKGRDTQPITVELVSGTAVVAKFVFEMSPGKHLYKIRVSCDPGWYHKTCDSIVFKNTTKSNIIVEQVQLCYGDSTVN